MGPRLPRFSISQCSMAPPTQHILHVEAGWTLPIASDARRPPCRSSAVCELILPTRTPVDWVVDDVSVPLPSPVSSQHTPSFTLGYSIVFMATCTRTNTNLWLLN